jgi:hypothetical protein
MHKLEITGDTPEALYFNVVKTLSIFLQGAAQAGQQVGAPPATQTTIVSITEPTERSISAGGAAQDVVAPKKLTKKEQAKLDAEAAAKPMPNDALPEVMTGKTIDADDFRRMPDSEQEAPPLTLDGDIRPRLQAIQAAHTQRGHDMPACVSYIQKLYGPFGIANAKQLKPEQFAEFMEASEAYLKGDV